ncbi:MAG: alpha/beta fold hydrolase [Gammaproteobacteria bacterium]
MNGFLSFVLLAALGYGAFAGFIYLMQPRLIYYPNMPGRVLSASPADIGLDYEAVTLQTDDGVRLSAWFIPHPAPRATLLFFHGNAGNLSHRLESIRLFHDLGLAVFIIDYRGYGQSEGSPTEAGTYRDAAAAWDHLIDERHIAPQEIVIFGRSLGGAIAAELASRTRPAALILESAFTSVPNMAARLYPWLPARWLSRYHYDTRRALEAITCPVLIIHSREDDIIPYTEGEQLFAHAREPKRFLELHGGHGNGFLVSREVYTQGINDFLERYVVFRPSD